MLNNKIWELNSQYSTSKKGEGLENSSSSMKIETVVEDEFKSCFDSEFFAPLHSETQPKNIQNCEFSQSFMIQGEDHPMLEDKREGEVTIRSQDTQVTAVSHKERGGSLKFYRLYPEHVLNSFCPERWWNGWKKWVVIKNLRKKNIFQVVHEIQAIREAMGGLGNWLSNLAPYV